MPQQIQFIARKLPAYIAVFVLFGLTAFACKLFIFSSNPEWANAQTLNRIQYVREGYIFIRSTGGNALTVSDGSAAGEWTSRFLLLEPNGKTVSEVTKANSDGGTDKIYQLTKSGDYEFITAMPFRVWELQSTANMVLQTNARKRTFKEIDRDHSQTKMYFKVPNGTNSFTFYAMATRGNTSSDNQAKLYKPDGSVQTLNLAIDGNGKTWSKVTISNPASGMWAASIRVSGSGSEGTFWVEGVPNFFSPTSSGWFEPVLQKGSVEFAIDPNVSMGKRGLVGAGRVYEPSAPPTGVKNAFLDLGLEANEVMLNHTRREDTNGTSKNDNNDPNVINDNGFDFSGYKGVDYTVETLKAQPVVGLVGAASWLIGQYPVTGCNSSNSDTDCKLREKATHAEWAEYAYAVAKYYAVTKKYNLKYLRLVDEPNIDGMKASEYASLINDVGDRLSNANESEVRSIKLYSGGVSELKDVTNSYIDSLISAVKPQYHQYLGIHPWMMGYGGYGNIYTTPFLKEKFRDFTQALGARGGTMPKRVIVSEVNAKYGDHSNQDEAYYKSFDHSLWWWSMLINAFSNAHTEAFLYYPFEDDGSIHNKRGMVYSDGTYKPVAYATKFFLKNVQNQVVKTQVKDNNQEVEALTTRSDDGKTMNIALVNKADRIQSVALTFAFTSTQNVSWIISKMNSVSDTTGKTVSTGQSNVSGTWTLPINNMDEQSLFSVVLTFSQAVAPTSTPTPTVTPTATKTPTPTHTPTSTISPTGVVSSTISPSKQPTQTVAATATLTPTPTSEQSTPTTVPATPTPYTPMICDADINESGKIDIIDYSILVNNLLKDPIVVPRADVNRSGKVDLIDYSYVVNNFYKTCTP